MQRLVYSSKEPTSDLYLDGSIAYTGRLLNASICFGDEAQNMTPDDLHPC